MVSLTCRMGRLSPIRDLRHASCSGALPIEDVSAHLELAARYSMLLASPYCRTWKALPSQPAKNIVPPAAESSRSRGDETQIEKMLETPHVVTYKPEAEPEAVKTYSDAEILASVKAPEPKPESKLD